MWDLSLSELSEAGRLQAKLFLFSRTHAKAPCKNAKIPSTLADSSDMVILFLFSFLLDKKKSWFGRKVRDKADEAETESAALMP